MLSGLDRLATEDAEMPAAVHWPYARSAPYNAALQASAKRQWDAAEALMTQALYADPVSEHGIGGLGQVRLWAGDTAGADAAFRISMQRGWRDPATHLYWMMQSINVADFATATIHADALLREPIDDKGRAQIVNPLLEYDGGRDALAARLRQRPQWADAFVWDIENEPAEALRARADVVVRAGRGIWSCPTARGLVDRLIKYDLADDAKAVHGVGCVPASKPTSADRRNADLINDPTFTLFLAGGYTSVLDWHAPDTADEVIDSTSGGDNRPGLHITTTRGVAMRVLSQRVVVHPGTYRLTWQMSDAAAARGLRAEMKCDSDLAGAASAEPVAGSRNAYAVNLHFAGDCMAPTLAFWIVPPTRAVTLNAVHLERVLD
jgi:hypothetical protein